MKTARQITLDLLIRMDASGSYSNIILDNAFTAEKLGQRDKAFAAALFYGVLERRMTLDYLIRHYSSIEFDRMSPKVIQIMRMGFYQLLYMNSVPESAAVDESVKLADYIGRGGAKSFINAVLRSFLRDEKEIDYKDLDKEGRLSIEYSCPKWLIKKWNRELGEERTLGFLKASFGRPPIYAKVNTYKFTTDKAIQQLKADGINAVKNKLLDDCIEISNTRSIDSCSAFRKGMFHVQDISSQLCCRIISPIFNETVVDLCASPGGKTFTCAEIMQNRGKIYSYDLYDGKVDVIRSGARRLGLSIITASENDAQRFNPDIPQADKVICDVPCSGLGVIRRKPEIKYKPMKSLEEIPNTQRRIIDTASRYVKVGGTLIYSTCTISRDENENVVEDFLKEHSEFVPIVVSTGTDVLKDSYMRTMLPSDTNGDGFFTATLRRIK
ncbi:MAG: 16S rRNA (cytosine(967)-C(5))-methyltransferase RsmB [Eubacterium sp.]|nr:16S rRNA (cytosine(967)-C(5))-methyltransferase RsmB [Eubacterium sp.]